MRKLLAAAGAAFVLLAGCGGGAGTTPPAALAPTSTSQPAAGAPQSVKISVVIGGRTSGQSNGRHPRFVSPSTAGIDIKAYAHGGSTVINESETDISSGSAACGGQTGTPRTCVVQFPVLPGNDDFVATTYDAAPSGNTFGSNAHALGTGSLNATIAPGTDNQLVLYISGVITALGYLAPNASLPADGATHNLGFVLNPADYGNNPITAGSHDPYANPITVQLTESGGSGHVQIVKNGTATGGTSTTLNYSTDTVSVRYDGGGAPGYDATVSVSANNVTPETLTLSPLYVSTTSSYYASGALSFTASGQTAKVNMSETGAANTTTFTATPSASCAGVATASAPSGPLTAASTTITAGSSGTCTIAFSDGTTTITWSVTVTTGSGTVTIPGNSVGPITFASYSNGPVRGQNGWLSNSCGGNDYDANVVPTSSYPSANWTGTAPVKALQVDNAVTQGCFSGLGSPPTTNSAGYPNALADTSLNPPSQCGPTCQPFFTTQFVVTSATGAWQPALEMSISPVWTNQGARMQYIGLWHTTDPGGHQKLLIFTNDVEGVASGYTAPCFECVNFVPYEIAYVDPTVAHTVGMTMQFVQPNADVVKFYVDGVLAGVTQTQFRSWEDYYFFDTESDPGSAYPYSRAVNDLLFHPGNVDTCLNFADYQNLCNQRTSGPGHTSTANAGFLFTNLTTCAGTPSSCASAITTSGVARSVQSLPRASARLTGAVRGLAQLR